MNPDLIANRLNSVFWPVSFKVVISKLLLCKQTEFVFFFLQNVIAFGVCSSLFVCFEWRLFSMEGGLL